MRGDGRLHIRASAAGYRRVSERDPAGRFVTHGSDSEDDPAGGAQQGAKGDAAGARYGAHPIGVRRDLASGRR